jgi:hypothetical protein
MAVNNPRDRVVIFRLTQGEYASLLAKASVEGARSFSDFARAKLLRTHDAPTLDEQLTELKTTVAHIAQLLERN